MAVIDPDCHYGDHLWSGTSKCQRAGCGARLRCSCGVFVREDNLNKHLRLWCPVTWAIKQAEEDDLRSRMG